MATLREEACKLYKSQRLIEAYILLKNLASDSVQTEPVDEQVLLSRPENVIDDPSITALISNVSNENRRPNFLQSVSITAAANVNDEIHLQKFRSDTESSHLGDHGRPNILRSKSTIETSKELRTRIKLTCLRKFLLLHRDTQDKRLVLTSSHKVPYYMFSVIPYRIARKHHHERTISGQSHSASIHHHSNIIDNVDIGDGKREVSFSHLLVPECLKKRNAHHDGEMDHLHDAHDMHPVIDYDPLMLDDPELTCGKHRKVLTLNSFTVSIIPYAKPSEVKKDINEQFKEKHPQLTITLTKLRSLKSELKEITLKMNLDIAVLANAYVYFEKAILKTKINKNNRKYIAGASLLLSIKFFDDVHGRNIKNCIEAIKDHFKLSHKDLLSCELELLVLLEFALQCPHHEVLPIIKRLETSLN